MISEVMLLCDGGWPGGHNCKASWRNVRIEQLDQRDSIDTVLRKEGGKEGGKKGGREGGREGEGRGGEGRGGRGREAE